MARGKREYGTGGLFRYTNSRKWTIQYRTLDGRVIREATGTSSKQEAQNMLTQRQAAIGRGEVVEKVKHYTVLQLWQAMVDQYRADNRLRAVRDMGDPDDAAKPQGRWLRIGPAFAHMAARAVTTDDLNRYVVQRKAVGAAAATVNRELGALRRAMMLGYSATPAKLQRVPKFPHLDESGNVRKGFITFEEFEQFCSAAHGLWLRTMLELGFAYGWRAGEMLALRVRNVDLREGTIRLEPGTTKNKQGREVVMTPQVRALLGECCAAKKPDDYVLTRLVLRSGKGNVQLPVRDYRTGWQALCCKVLPAKCWQTCKLCGHRQATTNTCGGCKRFHRRWKYDGTYESENGRSGLQVHDLRRSMAKAARAAGIETKAIMDAGGWKTIGVFHRYSIGDRRDQQRYASAMVQARQEAQQRDNQQIGRRLVGGEHAGELSGMTPKSLKPA